MFGDWEKFKVAVESSRQPELMLIVDKWQQLQFVSRDYFAKYARLMYSVLLRIFYYRRAEVQAICKELNMAIGYS